MTPFLQMRKPRLGKARPCPCPVNSKSSATALEPRLSVMLLCGWYSLGLCLHRPTVETDAEVWLVGTTMRP